MHAPLLPGGGGGPPTAPAAMAALARADVSAHPSDHSTARDNGAVGEVMSGDLSPELEAAARALRVGDVSDAVETAAGIHLLYRSA